MKKFGCFLSIAILNLSAHAYEGKLFSQETIDDALQRIGLNLYVGGYKSTTRKSEFASLSYDLSPDLSINVGTNVAWANQFRFIDMSIHNPWTVLSLQSSLDFGVSHYQEGVDKVREISQGVSLQYPVNDDFSIQLIMKRFTSVIYQFQGRVSLVALGIGMRV